MKFLVDAQLPRSLVGLLREAGHDATYTLDLPELRRTSKDALCQVAIDEQRVVVTKDGTFFESFLSHQGPSKLLVVATGNISNNELLRLFRENLSSIIHRLTASSSFAEIDHNGLTNRF